MDNRRTPRAASASSSLRTLVHLRTPLTSLHGATRGAPLRGLTGKGPTYPGRVGPRHPHHGGRWRDDADADLEHLRARRSATCARKSRAAAISSSTERPFIATVAPVGRHERHRPAEQALERSDRTRGHDVEGLGRRAGPRPGRGRRVTWERPSSATTSSRNVVRRSSGSTSVTCTSGRAIASTRPGQPGTGADVAHRGALGDRLAPARPSSGCAAPTVGAPRAGRSARARRLRWRAARCSAPPAAGDRTRTPSVPGRHGGWFHVKRRRSRGQDHHVALGLGALGLRRQAGGGHGVVDDLALERRSSAPARPARRTPCTSAIDVSASATSARRAARHGGRRRRASGASARRSRGRPPAGSAPGAPRAPRRCVRRAGSGRRRRSATLARSPSTSMSRSPSRSAMSRSSSR